MPAWRLFALAAGSACALGIIYPLALLRFADRRDAGISRWLGFTRAGLATLGLTLLVAGGALWLRSWRSLAQAGVSSPPLYIVSHWTRGTRDVRRTSATLAPEAALEGGVWAAEQVVAEGPALTRSSLLFALSFEPDRDGVHASFRGKDAYLTRDDLRKQHPYFALQLGRLELGPRLDRERVLELAARELGCSRDELLAGGTIRRFVSVRVPLTADPPKAGAVTANDLATKLHDAASFLAAAFDESGLLRSDPTRAEPDLALQGRIARDLTIAAHVLDEPALRVAGRRAALRLHEANSACGPSPCVGQNREVELAASAASIEAHGALARTLMMQYFLSDIRGLSAFLRAQQRSDGLFPARYDRAAQRAIGEADLETSAEVVHALTTAYGFDKDPATLQAIRKAAEALLRAPRNRFGFDGGFGATSCFALMRAARHAVAVEHALADCVEWSRARRGVQILTPGDDPFAGGIRPAPFALPSVESSAGSARALLATAAVLLNDPKRDSNTLGVLLDSAGEALSFIARQELPGDRPELSDDPAVALGAFSAGPFTDSTSLTTVQQSAAALVDYLALVKERDPVKAKKKPPPPFGAAPAP